MASTTKLSRFGTDTLQDPHNYISIVGALQYVTLTRPEVVYSVNKVCQFLSAPLESHWRSMKRILRYLGSTSTHGLLLQPAATHSPLSLRAYSDSDWGSDPDERRSTSGSCVYLGPLSLCTLIFGDLPPLLLVVVTNIILHLLMLIVSLLGFTYSSINLMP